MFGEKKRVDFCWKHRVFIGHSYIQHVHHGEQHGAFPKWFRDMYVGRDYKMNFLNECLEDYWKYLKKFPNKATTTDMLKLISTIPGDTIGEQGHQLSKERDILIEAIRSELHNQGYIS